MNYCFSIILNLSKHQRQEIFKYTTFIYSTIIWIFLLESVLGDLFISENRFLIILVHQQCQKLYWNILIHLSVPLLREELKRLTNNGICQIAWYFLMYSSHSVRSLIGSISQ